MDLEQIKHMSLEDWFQLGTLECECGKTHAPGTKKVIVESGAISHLPALLSQCGGKKPFLLSGKDTFAAAGDKVCETLDRAGIAYGKYVFPNSPVLPTEHSVGSAVMHFDHGCDAVVAIGSGVINDIGKILAHTTGKPYIIVATAPSMDGYASATSSMELDGRKVSLDSTFAYAIVGDLDILTQAPMKMLLAGVGDMVAKYVALAEWRMSALITGEYHCPVVDAMVETALDRCVAAGQGLIRREPEGVKAVMEGMVIAGMAMKYAGVSRPASGMEHYFSHIWDMRGLAFGTGTDLHGIQCGVGTLLCLKIYDYLRALQPDKERALKFVEDFSLEDWNSRLEAFIGPGAQPMIAEEKTAGKYDREKHARRLERILTHWDEIQEIIAGIPSYDRVLAFMQEIGAPVSAGEFGVTPNEMQETLRMTKDIRDKYIGSRLLWDLGVLEEAAKRIP